jgi:3-phosphoshikimate 1-carboxyvinyltransferase
MHQITPKTGFSFSLSVPGSKSLTQRALVAASLARGTSLLSGALAAEDTDILIAALRSLGIRIEVTSRHICVEGGEGRFIAPDGPLFLGNNGTALRFLTTLACLAQGTVRLAGVARLHERPVAPLVAALRKLGAVIDCPEREGFPPLEIHSARIEGGRVEFADLESSQYISSLLLGAPFARSDVEIILKGHTVSRPYIDLTLAVMRAFGARVQVIDGGYRVGAGDGLQAINYAIEGDASAASYFFLAAALTQSQVEVTNLGADSLQGDLRLLDILSFLGCEIEKSGSGLKVTGKSLIKGDCEFDMGDIPDMVPTVAVLSAFRQGKTRIVNTAHLKHKESDRLAVLAMELAKMQVPVCPLETGLEIEGGAPRGATINSHGDHRIAMAFAIAGLRLPGMAIEGGMCVQKSYPLFWEELAKI